jgi:hypothetical protein
MTWSPSAIVSLLMLILALSLCLVLWHLIQQRRDQEPARRKSEPCGPRVTVWDLDQRERHKISILRLVNK